MLFFFYMAYNRINLCLLVSTIPTLLHSWFLTWLLVVGTIIRTWTILLSIASHPAQLSLSCFPDLEVKIEHHVSVCSKVPSVWCSEVGLLHLAALLLFLGCALFSPCRAGISVAGSAERWALHSVGSSPWYILTATAQSAHLLYGQRQNDETCKAS